MGALATSYFLPVLVQLTKDIPERGFNIRKSFKLYIEVWL